MKRILLLVVLVTLAAVSVMGQDYGQAVRTNSLTRAMLEDLGMSEDEIQDLLDLQNQYMNRRAERSREIRELKRRLAEEFNSPDVSTRRINRLVRKINQYNLDEDLDQVGLYQKTRQRFGEERWNEVVRGTNAQDPLRTRTEEQEQTREQVRADSSDSDDTPVQTQTRTGDSGNAGNSGGAGSGSGSPTGSPGKNN